MDNHFHLLWHCPDAGLSDAMQRLGSMYTRHVNDRVGRDGPLFRGRFHSRLIVDERHLVATVRYIHRNALDLPGVGSAKAYRWSSHRTYLGLRSKPAWMCTSPVLDGWDVDEFDRFVDEELGAPLLAGALVRSDPDLALASSKVVDLVAGGWDNTGLTPVVSYRAARAAS